MRKTFKQMPQQWQKLGLGAMVIFMLMLASTVVIAKTAPTADIMIVLDLSGSMKVADSDSRFDSFFEWTTAFASTQDRIGVVAMGNRAKLIAPLTSKKTFSFSDIRRQLKHRSQYTDVAAGLENAYYELKNNARDDAAKLVLLLSDAQIDLPRGRWDLENSLRYMHSSLIPAMKREKIQLIAVVPEGLNANFQLLHEIANGTGGRYYRGIPGDAIAIRQKLAVSQQAPGNAAKNQAGHGDKRTRNKAKQAAARPASTPASASSKAADEKATAAHVQTDKRHEEAGIQSGFWILGGILLLGFAIVLTAMVVLFRRTATTGPSDTSQGDEELVDVLQELQSLKSDTENSDQKMRQYDAALDDDGEPDFGEPSDNLSVSLISPFLDHEEAQGTIKRSPTDEIAVRPAFSEEHSADSSFSVSNMETLIGTGMADIEEK